MTGPILRSRPVVPIPTPTVCGMWGPLTAGTTETALGTTRGPRGPLRGPLDFKTPRDHCGDHSILEKLP